MRITIVAVGRLKAGSERDLVRRYLDRVEGIGRSVGLSALQAHEIDESRERRADDRRAEEGRMLAAKLPADAFVVALDERGRDLTSEAFAQQIARLRDENRDAAFVIGGPDGLDPDFMAKAALRLRFGAMTVPHGLVRVLLAEQLYRATTILAGHPYHRGSDHRTA